MGWLRLNVAWKGGNVVCLFVQFLSFVLVAFGWARSAEACTCGRTKDVWDKYVVFVGKAVESVERPVDTDEDEEDFWGLQLAVRYEVEASNRLKKGDEVLVFRSLFGTACGGGTHRVGYRGIVVAYDTDGVLRTSSCAVIPDEEKASILKKLHLPEAFKSQGEPFSTEASQAVSPPNGGCASCSAGRGGPPSATSLLVSLGVLLSTRRRRRRNRV